jgi:hypothetical protein
LALTHHRLGHADEARENLDRLRELLRKPGHADNEDAKAFLAEALIGEK